MGRRRRAPSPGRTWTRSRTSSASCARSETNLNNCGASAAARQEPIAISCRLPTPGPRALASGLPAILRAGRAWLTTFGQTFRNPVETLIRTCLRGKGRRATRRARDIGAGLSRRRFVAGVQRAGALRNRRTDTKARQGQRRQGGRGLGALPARGAL